MDLRRFRNTALSRDPFWQSGGFCAAILFQRGALTLCPDSRYPMRCRGISRGDRKGVKNERNFINQGRYLYYRMGGQAAGHDHGRYFHSYRLDWSPQYRTCHYSFYGGGQSAHAAFDHQTAEIFQAVQQDAAGDSGHTGKV